MLSQQSSKEDVDEMTELLWKAGPEVKIGVVAVYKSHGAKIYIVYDEHTTPLKPGEVPEWVKVGQELVIKRIREYRDQTGHLPTKELMERFQDVMGKRLDAFIEDPRKYPYKPLTLVQFEQEEEEMKKTKENCGQE